MGSGSYTYPQFIIDDKTGRIKVNFIDKASGRVVRHIPPAELSEIVRTYCSGQLITPDEKTGVQE
jgi:uncharacterized FlaG/YvyC family protein